MQKAKHSSKLYILAKQIYNKNCNKNTVQNILVSIIFLLTIAYNVNKYK